MIKRTITIIIGIIFFGSCYYDKEEILYSGSDNCSSINASFAGSVNPIIQAHCAIAGCHDATSTNTGGPFINYDLIRNKASKIKIQVVNRIMPKGSTLSADDIKKISCWVDSGAPNN